MTVIPRHYLDFERPIAELEAKLGELETLAEDAGQDVMDGNIASLKDQVEEIRREAYANLSPWQKAEVARHPERPHFVDYLDALVDEFVELKGDRKFGDDQAIIGGLGRFKGQAVMVIGQEKGHDAATRTRHNFGMANPEGYRKAVRLMDLADQYGLPVITFIDTAGAFPGKGAEERGQAEAIARSTERCLTLGTPLVSTIIGEGGSGGAIAIAAGNRVLILQYSIYSVISPEGCASILWRDAERKRDAAAALKMTADDLIRFGVVDRIIDEPVGGAHSDPDAAIAKVGLVIQEELRTLSNLGPEELRRQRADRFMAIGRNL
jgi:acetyl-CoA carboxylase carboxyl transferase subunit alpha